MAVSASFRKAFGSFWYQIQVIVVKKRLHIPIARARFPAGPRLRTATNGREAMELLHHGFFGWILIGLVAGVLGKIIMPGKDPGGFIVTILIGIAGALLAGYLSPMMGLHIAAGWQSYAAATVGAIVLLALYRLVMTRRT
jgi:uncharacterized membrane protein YeaQ/YmgE (transglycosylase-associated protein family)